MERKLWPIQQLQEWIHRSDSKFVNLTSSEYAVLLAILKFADNYSWESHPSVKTIANLCLKDEKHVRDVIKRLAKKGIIKLKIRWTKEGDRDSNGYIVSVDNIWGVGANSPLRWGQIYPDGGGRSTPLTTNLTTNITKKQEALKMNRAKNKQGVTYIERNTTSEDVRNWNPSDQEKRSSEKAREECMNKLGRRRNGRHKPGIEPHVENR